jgi:hypothetical protein
LTDPLRAIRSLDGLDERRVFPSPKARELLIELEFEFPDEPTSPEQVLVTMDETGSLTMANFLV